jgi:hypothetical protein
MEARAAVHGRTVCGFADGMEARAAVHGRTVCGFADGMEARAAVHGRTVCGFADGMEAALGRSEDLGKGFISGRIATTVDAVSWCYLSPADSVAVPVLNYK